MEVEPVVLCGPTCSQPLASCRQRRRGTRPRHHQPRRGGPRRPGWADREALLGHAAQNPVRAASRARLLTRTQGSEPRATSARRVVGGSCVAISHIHMPPKSQICDIAKLFEPITCLTSTTRHTGQDAGLTSLPSASEPSATVSASFQRKRTSLDVIGCRRSVRVATGPSAWSSAHTSRANFVMVVSFIVDPLRARGADSRHHSLSARRSSSRVTMGRLYAGAIARKPSRSVASG